MCQNRGINELNMKEYSQDLEKLKIQLARDCLKINRVGNDGNSLFRAMGDQLGEEFMFHFYRQKTVEWIRENKGAYEDLIGNEDEVEEYCCKME
jgi:hypothetical protein